jgi:predicted transcriptional regulator
MDVLYRCGRASAREVMSEMGGEQAYSTIRTQLSVLEKKGCVRHEEVGRMYIYAPVVPADTAQHARCSA